MLVQSAHVFHGGLPALTCDATRYDAGEVIEGEGGLILVPIHLYTLKNSVLAWSRLLRSRCSVCSRARHGIRLVRKR